MIIGNILNRAMSIVGNTPVALRAVIGTLPPNVNGDIVTEYADAVIITASVQAVPSSMITFLGLDANKSYIMVYSSALIKSGERDYAGDQIIFGGDYYQVLSATNWRTQNGWDGTMAVKIQPPVIVLPHA